MGRTILLQLVVISCIFLGYAVGNGTEEMSNNIFSTTLADPSIATEEEIIDRYDKNPEQACHPLWFECLNKRKCIPPMWLCDGYPDCNTGEDEDDAICDKTVCDPTELKCKNKKCVSKQFICDDRDDCGDGSDQIVCDPFQCHPATIQCPSGKCIAYSDLCDGNNDCMDYSDEDACDADNCHPSAFQCLNRECISRFYFCREISGDQCGDNSNLKYCNKTSSEVCPSGWYECASRTRCIPSQWKCDQLPDCPDRSDENNCGNSTNVAMKLTNDTEVAKQKEILETIAKMKCDPDQFKCKSGNCVPINWMCDYGRDYCKDGSYLKLCQPFNCHPAFYQCLNGKCISMNSICNGKDDCGDNSDEQVCSPHFCHPSAFQCLNKNCINRHHFCSGYGGDKCGDNSNQLFCKKRLTDVCPNDWFECADKTRCIPSQWVCDGHSDCQDNSEEIDCGKTSVETIEPIEPSAAEELRSWILSLRKSGARTEHWGAQVPRIAVALHLSDESTFSPGSSLGDEIRYELTIQLLSRQSRKKLSTHELALYVHALLVACVDPRDFYGSDLIGDLRSRVEAADDYVDPFLLLVLCNSGDVMTAKDVKRLTGAYDSRLRPLWTDTQALSSMALSCVASRTENLVDESILPHMLKELKKRQIENGTVDNFRSTALVAQAMYIDDSYAEDFDLDKAKKVLVDGLSERQTLLNAYYVLPVLLRKSFLNVSSSHCIKQVDEKEEALQKAFFGSEGTISIQYSVWMGDEKNVGQSWKLKMPVNSTVYDAIETVAKMDSTLKVEYDVVDGKPYVMMLNGKGDGEEAGRYWYIYQKPLFSEEQPKVVELSPVDVKLTHDQEIILWYKHASWNPNSWV